MKKVKIIKGILNILILSILIYNLLTFFNNKTYAISQMSNLGSDIVKESVCVGVISNLENYSSSENSSNVTSTTQKNKSSNANLSNLGIRPNDFSGFIPGTTTYNVTVPEDVENIEVYATVQDSKSTLSGTGNKKLQYGENTLSVVVRAEDGTKKTYTLNVVRENKEEINETVEKTEEVIKGLSNIIVGNLKLSPSFKTDTYEYSVKYNGKDTMLDIQTIATEPSYTVEILGNEELKEGENIITILVNDDKKNNVATYQLTVSKSIKEEVILENENENEEDKQQEKRKKMIIIGGIIGTIVIIIIIATIKRRNRIYAEEFSDISFTKMSDEEDNNYYQEQSHVLQERNNEETLLEEIPRNEIQEIDKMQELDEIQEFSSNKKYFEDIEEKKEREKAKREFLEGYNSNYTDKYEKEKTRKSRKKGKRFK